MKRRMTLGALVVTAVLAAGCGVRSEGLSGGGGGGGGSDRGSPVIDSGPGLGVGDDYSVAEALTELPSTEGDDIVDFRTAHLDAASAAAGLERPDGTDREELSDWLFALQVGTVDGETVPVYVPFASVFNLADLPSGIEEFEEEVGWSLVDVDAFVASSIPPKHMAVMVGDHLEDAVEAEGLVEVADGIVSAGDGEDFELQVDERSVARPLGQPMRMAVADGRLAVSTSTPLLEAWLSGEEPSAADDEALATIAVALDRADVVSANLVREGESGDGADAFDAYGIGWAAQNGEARITVAWHYADDRAALAAAPRIEGAFTDGVAASDGQPLRELVEVVEVAAEGSLVVATFGLGPEGRPDTMVRLLLGREVGFGS